MVVGLSCGALDQQAPRAVQRAQGDIEQCKSFEQLMPNFIAALKNNRTENLARLIKTQLLVSPRDGVPPPVMDVLRAVFNTLATFAHRTPERGAPAGELCAVMPPPLEASNELCEMRRALDLLVHEGKGLDALKLLDPLLRDVIGYVLGKSSDATPHYEVTTAISGLFAQDKVCQLNDTLDLTIAMVKFLESPKGQPLFDHLNGVVDSAGFKALLGSTNPETLKEEDLVNLSKVLLSAIKSAQPADLDNLLNNPLLSKYKADFQPVVGDLKVLLDPSTQPSVTVPMRKVLTCVEEKDKNSDLIRMLYRLALRDKKPELGLTKIVGVLRGIRELDQRGSFIHLIGTLAAVLRADSLGVDAAAKVVSTLLAPRAVPPEVRSNAELALPVIDELLASGVGYEAICAIDTLIYGCAGGTQPACITP